MRKQRRSAVKLDARSGRSGPARWYLAVCAPLIALLLIGGCATYQTPGTAANFRAMGLTPEEVADATDWDVSEKLDRQPLASFPASIAVARVQGRNYRSHTARGYGSGNYTLVTIRDVEKDEDFERLTNLPMVDGVAALNRLVVTDRIRTERDLRVAAASVQADMLLLYTFDTSFGSESRIAPLSTITLGLFPEREARVTSTVSAILVDTRNGFVYGLAEGTSETTQLANAWTSRSAVDQSRRRAEREAFVKVIDQFENTWQNVVRRYGPDIDPVGEVARHADG